MENYQMNRSYNRPYRSACGMPKASAGCEKADGCTAERNSCETGQNCGCHTPVCDPADAKMSAHIDCMVPAMAYVPRQEFAVSYDLCYALREGTIFPELCKPFCGKRGVQK